MWLEKFIKRQFISFYKDNNYKVLVEITKNKKRLDSFFKEFDKKNELEKYINNLINENPQTFISSILLTINQGVINSCSKAEYKKREIDINNIKYICINNKYSIYASIFDISKFLKDFSFDIDFLYSIFAIIDFYAKKRKNRFYVLVLKEYLAILGYENFIPIFSDFIELNAEKEEIEEIDDLDIIDHIDEEIEEISEDIEELEVNEEELTENLDKLTTDIEIKILNHIKDSIKDYYKNYSNDFIEEIIILDTIGIDEKTSSLIEDETFITTKIEKFDLLKTINKVSIESL